MTTITISIDLLARLVAEARSPARMTQDYEAVSAAEDLLHAAGPSATARAVTHWREAQEHASNPEDEIDCERNLRFWAGVALCAEVAQLSKQTNIEAILAQAADAERARGWEAMGTGSAA